MNLNKALNHYNNPELENYLVIKDIFSNKGFKIVTTFDFKKGFDKENNALFYFFDFYADRPESFLRVGINSIPIFFDDILEFTSYPSQKIFQLDLSLSASAHQIGASFIGGGMLGLSNQKKLMSEIYNNFDSKDTHYVVKLKKSGSIRDKYESILDSNQLSVYLQSEVFLSNNFLKNNKDAVKGILDSNDLILHDFNLDNLLHLKVLYYDSLNKKIAEYSRIKTERDRHLFLKSLKNDAIKRGKKLERVYLYTQNVLKKDQLMNKMKDFTYFKFI